MPQDISFEQRFGQLVDVELNDKLPSLVEYRVGFQVIDKTDDDTKAVGVYAFVLNDTWLYIPVFFIDGRIEGMELMYIKQKDMFVPSMDNWVAAINEQGVQVLGNAISREQEQNEGIESTPESTNTTVSTTSLSKFASEAFGDNSPLDKEAVDRMFKYYNHVDKTKLPSLEDMLPELNKEAQSLFVNTLLKDVRYGNALFRHYSADQIEKLAKQCVINREAIAEEEPKKVQYITNKMSKEAKELSDKEKKLLVRHNLYIKDHRTNFTEVFMENIDTSVWENPVRTGIYEVLLADGTSDKRIIIVPREINDKYSSHKSCYDTTERNVALVKIDGGDAFEWKNAKEIYCKPTTGVDTSLVEKYTGGMRGSMKSLQKVEEGAYLLFVDISKPTRSIKATVHSRRKDASGALVVSLTNNTFDNTGRLTTKEVVVRFTDSGKLCVMGDVLYVPSDKCRVFIDYPLYMARRKEDAKHPNGGDITKVAYGTPSIFRDCMYGVTTKGMGRVELTMSPNGNYGSVRDANGHTDLMPKEAVAQVLCEGFNISGQNAMRMMKHACMEEGGKSSYILKVAAPFDLSAYKGTSLVPFMGGPSAKQDANDPTITVKTTRGKALNGPSAADGSRILPESAIEDALKASESGIREVLDVAVLERLLDKADITELRKDYISEMIQGMDSIGRMLFLYYWHNDRFEDKYGRDKMRELQDHLKEVFNATGDLVLFLKEKTTFNPNQTESVLGTLSEDVATAGVE